MTSEQQPTTSETPVAQRDWRDALFPTGRPRCTRCNERPVYLGGLCGDCYAEDGRRQRDRRTPR